MQGHIPHNLHLSLKKSIVYTQPHRPPIGNNVTENVGKKSGFEWFLLNITFTANSTRSTQLHRVENWRIINLFTFNKERTMKQNSKENTCIHFNQYN